MRVYLSGPVAGIPNDNREAFNNAEEYFLMRGYEVVNPIKIGEGLKLRLKREPMYKEYLLEDISYLMYCHIIYLLPNWEQSTRAVIERDVAKGLHLMITSYLLSDEEMGKFRKDIGKI